MIVSSSVGARCRMDAWREGDRDACEYAAKILVEAVVAEGEGIGAFIRPESVWVTIARSMKAMEMNQFDMWAVWAPDPAKGVDLRGGPMDGDVLQMPRASGGMPVEVIHAPFSSMPDWGAPISEIAASGMRVVSYRRAGIDSAEDRWVYMYEGES